MMLYVRDSSRRRGHELGACSNGHSRHLRLVPSRHVPLLTLHVHVPRGIQLVLHEVHDATRSETTHSGRGRPIRRLLVQPGRARPKALRCLLWALVIAVLASVHPARRLEWQVTGRGLGGKGRRRPLEEGARARGLGRQLRRARGHGPRAPVERHDDDDRVPVDWELAGRHPSVAGAEELGPTAPLGPYLAVGMRQINKRRNWPPSCFGVDATPVVLDRKIVGKIRIDYFATNEISKGATSISKGAS